MAEINNGDNKPKLIAFYLPQFHEIPENNEWWGQGFTEWTNVRAAKPLFEGHDEPRIPLNRDYYNLLDDKVKIAQAQLASSHGVYGFCYYHYWFKDGKKLLEKPAEQMLKNQDIEMPFCFCWANENWSKNWDGGNQEIIMKQEYGREVDWEKHFQYLLPFFKDSRYITVNGKLLFVIYKPEQIADIEEMVKYFDNRAKENGFPGVTFAFQFPTYFSDMYYKKGVFDYRIGFEPVYSRNAGSFQSAGTTKKVELARKVLPETWIAAYRKHKQKNAYRAPGKAQMLSVYFYDETWERIINNKWDPDFMPGAFVDWDNTPRNKHGLLYFGFSIEKFREYLGRLYTRAVEEQKPMIFINAWNEWGEGAFLEPDEKYGTAKLDAINEIFGK